MGEAEIAKIAGLLRRRNDPDRTSRTADTSARQARSLRVGSGSQRTPSEQEPEHQSIR
jgi:hypothetical protein